ncbi:acyl-CoA synthetase [Eoetvoesiella caeni]
MNDRYPDLYSSYQWFVPTQFNIAQACVHRWAENPHEGRRPAIYFEDEHGAAQVWSYTQLAETCNRLANGLVKMGVNPGDRVAIVMEQRPEFVVACMAVLSVGAIAVPLSAQWGPDGLGVRLRDAEARVAVVDTASGADLLQAQVRCPALAQIVGLGFQHDNILPWNSLLARQPVDFKPVPTRSDSPALLLYGGTGPSGKTLGTVHAHSTLIGNLPGFVAGQNWFPQTGNVFWSPSEWTWYGGLLNALLPTMYFGRSIVATTAPLSGAGALDILERYRVTNAFFVPGALELIMAAAPIPRESHDLALRNIMASGASLPIHVYEWCRQALGVTPNEMFGQAQANHVVGNSHLKWPAIPGSLGRPYPGHLVTVLDDDGNPCPANIIGEIAVNRYDIQGYPDPAVFQRYWRNEAATHAHLRGDWLLTGDLAIVDKQGYFWHCGRRGNTPNSPGQHIQPADILLARAK